MFLMKGKGGSFFRVLPRGPRYLVATQKGTRDGDSAAAHGAVAAATEAASGSGIVASHGSRAEQVPEEGHTLPWVCVDRGGGLNCAVEAWVRPPLQPLSDPAWMCPRTQALSSTFHIPRPRAGSFQQRLRLQRCIMVLFCSLLGKMRQQAPGRLVTEEGTVVGEDGQRWVSRSQGSRRPLPRDVRGDLLASPTPIPQMPSGTVAPSVLQRRV